MAKPPTPLAPATATISLGSPGIHKLESILKAAAHEGLQGIEICNGNLRSHAAEVSSKQDPDLTNGDLITAAEDIKRQCDDLGLIIFVLQPFAAYEGWLNSGHHEQLIEKFKLWLKLASTLGCDIIQVPSNTNRAGTTGDIDKIVADMLEIADLAAKQDPVVRIAYEALSWGAHVDLWEHSWDIVRRVDRANFGLCLDTYHIAGRVFADPAAEKGITPNAKEDLIASMLHLVKDLDVSKVFYLQLSDAEKLDSPLVEGHPYYEAGLPSRMCWSRNARLFPFEEILGGFLPVLSITKAIVNELGYRGWISMEVFSRHLQEKNESVPMEFAIRAMRSYRKVSEALGWDFLL